MKRLTMLVAAGLMGLMLAACGDNAPKAPTETTTTTETTVSQPATTDEAAPATTEEAAPATTEAGAADAQTQE